MRIDRLMYSVILKDVEGSSVSTASGGRMQRGPMFGWHDAFTLQEAKRQARFMISDLWAKDCGATHEELRTDRAEIIDWNGHCVWQVSRAGVESRNL